MQSYFKRTMLLAAALLLTAGAWAQKTHTGYYLYHGKRVEVPVNSEVALAYFRTAQMDTAAIHRRYQCLKEVSLAADKADTLYACEVQLPEGTYEEGVAWLKAQPEVWDVEPVIGTTERVPVSNMFFVKLREQGDAALLAEEAAKCGARHEGPVLPGDLWHIVTVDKHSAGDALTLSTQLGESGKFADVDPGFAYQIQFNVPCPRDTFFAQYQWNMMGMEFCDVWADGIKGTGIKVAIIDNGVDISHPEFSSMTVAGSRNASVAGTTPASILGNSNNSHATELAGIIFSNHDSLYIAGVAPKASLVNISFAAPNASYSDDLVAAAHRAFSYAVDTAHSDVILCAWDLLQTGSTPSSILEADIVNAMENGRYGKGATVVFAAGNGSTPNSDILYPANFDDRILVVGGYNDLGERVSDSRYGQKLDLVAPGDAIATTEHTSPYSYTLIGTGTSLAAAHVAGLAALMLSYDTMLSREQLDWCIKRAAVKTSDYTFSYSATHKAGTWNSELGYGKANASMTKLMVDQLSVTQSDDVVIRDFANDIGKEPTSMAITSINSPDIHVIDTTTNTETTYLVQGKKYHVKVTVHNNTSQNITVNPSDIKVYWTTKLSALRWNSSWDNCGCNNINCDVLSVIESSPTTILANSSEDFTARITLPKQNSMQSCR